MVLCTWSGCSGQYDLANKEQMTLGLLVNIASCLQGETKGLNNLIISESTYDLLRILKMRKSELCSLRSICCDERDVNGNTFHPKPH
ncbi:hypothetical protein CS542_07255 [Pedobacter sp. IW39]|nr:hypothetical protein CS542_07255 [Pedobacter sp. IW39]